MGLFGFKKKEEKEALPPLQFPELPKTVPNFEESKPFSSAQGQEIKNAVSTQALPGMAPSHRSLPSMGMEDKPLFVKIDKYKDVVHTLNKVRTRLHDADSVLRKITELKRDEDRELQAWQHDLQEIREQLLDIDKTLFE